MSSTFMRHSIASEINTKYHVFIDDHGDTWYEVLNCMYCDEPVMTLNDWNASCDGAHEDTTTCPGCGMAIDHTEFYVTWDKNET